MFSAEISNNQNIIKNLDEIEALIKKTAAAALEYEAVKVFCEISISLVDNAGIKKLNFNFRAKNNITDVLSFPSGDYPTDEDSCFLGDIAISLERALEQSVEFGHSFEREVAFLTAHSMLHLLGYDHMNSEDEAEMMRKQEDILLGLGISRK